MSETKHASPKALVVAAGALAIAIGGLFYWQRDTSAPLDAPTTAIAETAAMVEAQHGHDEPRPQVVPATAPALRNATAAEFSGSRVIAADDEYYAAQSDEDALWLNRNGFPTKDMLDEADALGFAAELPAEPSSTWDLAKASVVVYDKTRREEAMRVLESGATRGSIFALEALAEGHAANGDENTASAYRFAALLRGDPRMIYLWSSGSTEVDRVSIVRGMTILERMNQSRARNGWAPFSMQMRPGFAEQVERGSKKGSD